ncbi:MAG TPA: non-homologous end-joining DNA ligase [Candidatus Polarisedimenticolaceae bacterium]|nr:non-homologous end-joining DNA ligase [Candidatus Polarisedimenticolaceae bacterium]
MKPTVTPSNPQKVLFPEDGITKGDLIAYYARVASAMLPHVRGRIVTMERYPDGIAAQRFFQKNVPAYFPEWIRTVPVEKRGGRLRQLVIENAETLAYLANQACVTIHVWPSRCDRPHHPDRILFDIDPPDDDFVPVRQAARVIRGILEGVGLTPYVMTTGSRGLHVAAALDRRSDFERARAFAVRVAQLTVAAAPSRFTIEPRKDQRGGRVFIDYLRNAYAQHGVAPYSVRARPGAPVATPLAWEELDDPRLHARRFTLSNLFRRLARRADPWKEIGRAKGSLERALRALP